MKQMDPIIQGMVGDLSKLIDIQQKFSEPRAPPSCTVDRLATDVLRGGRRRAGRGHAGRASRVRFLRIRCSGAASGYTSRIESSGRDEATELLSALRDMNSGLGAMVTHIRTGAEAIAGGASEVASATSSCRAAPEEHASRLRRRLPRWRSYSRETQRRQRATAPHRPRRRRAARDVCQGREHVPGIHDSSRRISGIIGVIDGISLETNILAPHAVVEAARAGEQGRGFAGSRPPRCAAESAKEIRSSSRLPWSRVEAGSRLVEQAGKTMDELVGSVKKVAEIMMEIASAKK